MAPKRYVFLSWHEKYSRKTKKMKWKGIMELVKNVQGKTPDSDKGIKNAVTRMHNWLSNLVAAPIAMHRQITYEGLVLQTPPVGWGSW